MGVGPDPGPEQYLVPTWRLMGLSKPLSHIGAMLDFGILGGSWELGTTNFWAYSRT